MNRHTPFIVVSIGVINPEGILYRLKEGENPVYERYATGSAKNMIELANQLNYTEAEKHKEVAVAQAPREMGMEESVGIPTAIPPEVRLEAVQVAFSRADAGKINLVEFKRRVHAALYSEDLIG